MVVLVVLVLILALAAALTLAYYLLRVILALRGITTKLAEARALLFTAASQTEPLGDLVGGIGGNVGVLHELVNSTARSLGLVSGGYR